MARVRGPVTATGLGAMVSADSAGWPLIALAGPSGVTWWRAGIGDCAGRAWAGFAGGGLRMRRGKTPNSSCAPYPRQPTHRIHFVV
jgi:hypothetical protein